MRLACFQPDIALNVGAMIRTCACFSAGIDIIEPCGFPFSLKAVRRSAMDYATQTNIARHISWDAFRRSTTARIVLLTTQAPTSCWGFSFDTNDILLVGQESAGVPQAVHDSIPDRIYIPTHPNTRSLNVSTAAAIALAEAKRQECLHKR